VGVDLRGKKCHGANAKPITQLVRQCPACDQSPSITGIGLFSMPATAPMKRIMAWVLSPISWPL
jgi:hypothetical protein